MSLSRVIFEYAVYGLALFAAVSLTTYIVPCIIQALLPAQNLKERYNATWALVTGGSSGIGLAIVERLASEGINVVVAALDDDLMAKCKETLPKTYKNVEFVFVNVDLSNPKFMDQLSVLQQPINLVFNNAGFIKPGIFQQQPIGLLKANFDVNAACTLQITHHFSKKMIERSQKGLVCFTSSSGGFLPSPMGSIYSSTKIWMTNFAVSIGAELYQDGIDTMVVHPSPIASNFYKNANGMSVLLSAEKGAQGPSVIADVIWKNAGRFVVVDQGWISVLLKIVLKMLEWNTLGELMRFVIPLSGDYKRFKARKEE
ncbi:hypothetical protein EDD86DRAFT_207869 [Gorgonomyces haynaldii]|nr:hypothetical protein EDD86DRAFT_207869 [Gorgonomyces haynaldii]